MRSRKGLLRRRAGLKWPNWTRPSPKPKKDSLVDAIIVKTQGFVNGNIKEGDKNPVNIFRNLLALYKGIDRDALRENMRYFLAAIMPVCEKYGVNMCVHPDDPPFQVLGLPRIVTNEEDIALVPECSG